MRYSIELLRKVLRTTYDFLFVTLLAMFVENVFMRMDISAISIILLAGMFYLSLIFRNIAKRQAFSVMGHIIFVLIIYSLSLHIVKTVVFIIVDIGLLYSATDYISKGRKLKPMDGAPWPSILIAVMLYLFGLYQKADQFIAATYIIILLMLVVHFINTYVEGLKLYIDSTKDVQGLPLSKVISRNNVIVMLIVVILITGLIISYSLDYSHLVEFLKKILFSVVSLIASVFAIFRILLNGLISTKPIDTGVGGLENANQLGGAAKEAGDSLVVLLYVGIAVIVFVIMIKVLKYVFMLLMSKGTHAGDVVEVVEKKRDVEVTKNKRHSLFGRMSKEDRLRSFYKKKILSYRHDISLRNAVTCREICEQVEHNRLGDVAQLTDIYASVRYGKKEVDKELLREATRLSKK